MRPVATIPLEDRQTPDAPTSNGSGIERRADRSQRWLLWPATREDRHRRTVPHRAGVEVNDGRADGVK